MVSEICIRQVNKEMTDLLTVVWTKKNPTPWNTIQPNENTKMLTVNQKFEKEYVGWLCALSSVVALTFDFFFASWERHRL